MSATNRRSFVKTCLTAALGSQAMGALALAAEKEEPKPPAGRLLGKLVTRPSAAIAASPLSIGFETLDRRMFDPERTYEPLAQLGVKWARVQTGWARSEPEKGRYDFAWLDQIIDRLLKIGVQPWFNLGYGNPRYTPESPDPAAVGWTPMGSEDARQGWLRFVGQITKHFAGRVRHWEIWNEPNISLFWRPSKPSPAGYTELVRITAPEIRKRAPGAVIIGGAISGTATEFLKGCLDQGMGSLVDKISYHPYQLELEKHYEQTLIRWREMLARSNPRLALWQGECGCPSEQGSLGALGEHPWNETRQAKWILRRVLSDLRMKIELISVFHLVDLVRYTWPGGLNSNLKKPAARLSADFGLLRGSDYSRKPSFHAFQALCTLFDAQTQRAGLSTEIQVHPGDGEPIAAEGICSAGFARGNCPLYAWWCPTDIRKEFPPRRISLSVAPGSQLRLAAPVLVDPLSQEIRQLDATAKPGGRWHFADLPLVDYPLLLTDSSAVTVQNP